MTTKDKLIELMASVLDNQREANVPVPPKVRPGTIRQAAEIGCCHPRTIARYGEKGLLHPIRISARCVRYDLNEVDRLFTNGAEAQKAG